MTVVVVVVVVVVLAVSLVRLAPRWSGWARLWNRAPSHPVEELPLDDPDPTRRLIARLIVRVNIADSVNRRLRAIVLALVGIVGLLLVGMVIVASLVIDARHQADQREADRVERTAGSCLQDRDTRARINKGNDAKRAIEHAINVMQTSEIDTILQPLTTAPLPTDPTQRAASEAFRANYTTGRQAVLDVLDEATTAIDAAQLADRDCTPQGVNQFLTTTTSSGG